MNRKILLSVLILACALLATTCIGMVSAGKGQTKQDFVFVTTGNDGPGPNSKFGIVDESIFQARDWVWYPITWAVKVGGVTISSVSYVSSMDMMLDLATGHGTVRVTDTITFEDGSTLVLTTAETMTDWNSPDMVGEGSFVGHGTGSLAGVQVVGTTSYVYGDLGPTRVGVVMGWPD